MFRTQVVSIPDNAVQCIGPLMYDLNRYITPDGQLFNVHATTGKITKINISKQRQWAWGDAKQLLPDGTITKMPVIEGFYDNQGRCTPHTIMAYYFIEKIDPTGMRAIKKYNCSKEEDTLNLYIEKLHVNNYFWGTKQEQDKIRLDAIRTLVDPDNICKFATNVDLSEYKKWNTYYFKYDGSDVIAHSTTKEMRRIQITVGSDKYHHVVLHINNTPRKLRINRVMAAIHLDGFDIDNKDQMIDHIDGNTLNNHPSNLAVVSLQENTRRGGSANPMIKVDPNNMIIVEEIRCVVEYAENNNLINKTLLRVSKSGEPYAGFIWLDISLNGTLFSKSDSGVITLLGEESYVINYIRSTIDQMYVDGILNEETVPINSDGIVLDTPQMANLIKSLDPRGIGCEATLNEMNARIQDHLPCSRIISIHGSCANKQMVLCLKTMLVYTRSRDNLALSDRKCPLCSIKNRSKDNVRFQSDAPEMGIPVFSYLPAAGNRAGSNPLGFVKKYLTLNQAIEDGGRTYSMDKLKAMRKSLFGLTNKSSDNWLKQSNGFPKRLTYADLYWSFYQPVNDKLNERTADWLLKRRLECAVIVAMRSAFKAMSK